MLDEKCRWSKLYSTLWTFSRLLLVGWKTCLWWKLSSEHLILLSSRWKKKVTLLKFVCLHAWIFYTLEHWRLLEHCWRLVALLCSLVGLPSPPSSFTWILKQNLVSSWKERKHKNWEDNFLSERKITIELDKSFLVGKSWCRNWWTVERCNPPFSHFPLWWWEISQTTAPQQ